MLLENHNESTTHYVVEEFDGKDNNLSYIMYAYARKNIHVSICFCRFVRKTDRLRTSLAC